MPAMPETALARRSGAVWRVVALVLWACFAGVGCVSGRAFIPAEHVTALGPGRQLAAEYTVREGDRMVAEVRLWSRGASRNSGEDDDDATVVEVGFAIQNHTDGVVRLDTKELSLRDVRFDDEVLPPVSPLRVSGSPEVRPGEEREVTAVFRLPGSVWPTEVKGYRVMWTLTNGGRYHQETPFVAAVTHYHDEWPYYYSPFHFELYGGYYWPYRYRVGPGWRYRRYYYRGYP